MRRRGLTDGQWETIEPLMPPPKPTGRPRSDLRVVVEGVLAYCGSCARARHRGRPPSFDREAYRRRSVIECRVGWLKERRRIATRFEKPALDHLAIIKVAIMQRHLKIPSSDRA